MSLSRTSQIKKMMTKGIEIKPFTEEEEKEQKIDDNEDDDMLN